MKKYMFKALSLIIAMSAISLAAQGPTGKLKVRIKDVTRMKGDETYTLVGYGLVCGLNNTGDSDESLIQRTIKNLMQNFNVIVNEDDLKAQNTAAVMVTATVREGKRAGDMVHADVSSISDAQSLTGGVLLLTPLLGADGEVWGIGQGPITTGGWSYGSSGAGGERVIKNHPTTGMLTNGVKLIKDIRGGFKDKDIVTLYLKEPDFTSAVNLADAINGKFFGTAMAKDSSTVIIRVPNEFKDEEKVTSFVSEIEQLYFYTDSRARVVFNERTGTIVMGHNVRISNAAVSHANLYVDIKKVQAVSQPSAFARVGETEVINDETTTVTEQESKVFEMPNTTTVGELVSVLNSLGVSSREIIIIFHCLKAAGALHAELEAL